MSYDTLTLAGRHVPDAGSGPFSDAQEAQEAGYDVLNPVTGMYEIGAIIDGQFVTILSEKASLIFDRVAAAKAAQDAAQPSEPVPTGTQVTENTAGQANTEQVTS